MVVKCESSLDNRRDDRTLNCGFAVELQTLLPARVGSGVEPRKKDACKAAMLLGFADLHIVLHILSATYIQAVPALA